MSSLVYLLLLGKHLGVHLEPSDDVCARAIEVCDKGVYASKFIQSIDDSYCPYLTLTWSGILYFLPPIAHAVFY